MFHVKHNVIKGNVSRETLDTVHLEYERFEEKFNSYSDLLLSWNKKVNLVSRDLTKSELKKHIYHSLMIQYSSRWIDKSLSVIDAGSGGGLPGIPLAIVSENNYRLIDIVEKKMMVCRDIVRQLGLKNVRCEHANIESVDLDTECVYVTKHAFKLKDFIQLTSGQQYECAIFLKGEDYIDELADCEAPLILEVINLSDYHTDVFFKGKFVITLYNPHEKSGT
jgi:16S rRNA (guanine527-N7)-methyltransferase